jgi:hypothetical protein
VSTTEPGTRMDEHWAPVSATRLILTVGSWVVGLFGLLRLDWVQQRVLLSSGSRAAADWRRPHGRFHDGGGRRHQLHWG